MSSNLPEGFEDPAFDDRQFDDLFTDDEYLIEELPHIKHLDTEDKNLEQE